MLNIVFVRRVVWEFCGKLLQRCVYLKVMASNVLHVISIAKNSSKFWQEKTKYNYGCTLYGGVKPSGYIFRRRSTLTIGYSLVCSITL